MYINLIQQIRDLTLQADTLVSKDKIEQCLEVLVQRQALLEELMQQYQTLPEADLVFKENLVELITWIQAQDAVNNSKVVKLRELSKENSVTQRKISKAIHHYNNIT